MDTQPVMTHVPNQGVPLVICARTLPMRPAGRPSARRDAILREIMRLARQSFRRGMAHDFRSGRDGGPRRCLPLV